VTFPVKRIASAVLCLALLCGAALVDLRRDLSASPGSDALTGNRPASVVLGQFGTPGALQRVFVSGRQVTWPKFQPAVLGAAGRIWGPSSSSRLAWRSTCLAHTESASGCAERGPPHHPLS